ncbi:MAG: hypothetical protein K9N06_01235 [Candidatus Cloacimonetes bacterium]|nr:hypothetical protein [Candidatus Cloacimonadota bacterium]
MRKIMIFLIILVLLSCANDNDKSSGDLFSIEVVDASGDPVSGLIVRVNNGYYQGTYRWLTPKTGIIFSLSEASDVKIDIYDLENQHVRCLVNKYWEAGWYNYLWTGKNDADEPANIGGTNIFRYEMIVRDHETNEITFQDTKYMCLELQTLSSRSDIGTTDENGRLSFNNNLAFPHIFNLGPQPGYDENAVYVGDFSLSDLINIKLIDPLTEEYVLYLEQMSNYESNHYHLVWEYPQSAKSDGYNINPITYAEFDQDLAVNLKTSEPAADEITAAEFKSRSIMRDADGSGAGTANDGEAIFESGFQLIPSSTVLSSFTAEYFNGEIILQWITQNEINNAGWNVYRSESGSLDDSYRINPELIPGAGTSAYPSEYVFCDEYDIEEGLTYHYWLESVAFDGNGEIYEPISIMIPDGSNPPVETKLYQNYPNPFN